LKRLAIKLAYDGRCFHGSQRQPGARTVEGDLIDGLMRIGAIDSTVDSRFQMASRTDRGVSALGNVMAVDTDFDPEAILRALNAVCDDIYAYGIAELDHDVSVRRAEGRWYRYLLPSRGIDADRFVECASLFVGEMDMVRFCRPEGRSTRLTIDGVSVSEQDGILLVDIRARYFLWNMVRRMVAAMEAVGRGEATLEEVKRALKGEDIVLGIVPGEGLTLMDVTYDFSFDIVPSPTLQRRLNAKLDDTLWRLALLEGIQKMVKGA
jgi:tRNA pseudouridine38-40 synthase